MSGQAAPAYTREMYVEQKRNLALDRFDRELVAARRWWHGTEKPAARETVLWFQLAIATVTQELERLDAFAAGEAVSR